jgi:hypothetical protein
MVSDVGPQGGAAKFGEISPVYPKDPWGREETYLKKTMISRKIE